MNSRQDGRSPLTLAQEQLADFDLHQRILRQLATETVEDALTPLDLLKAAHGTLYRTALSSLLSCALAAIEADDCAQALALADALARRDPGSLALRVYHTPEGADARPNKATLSLARFLEERLLDEAWLGAEGENDLRATLGLNCFKAERLGLAARLLGAVRWQDIGEPMHYLGAFSLLYWGGLAAVANQMVAGLVDNQHWSITRNAVESPSLGVACAYSGLSDKAVELLAPLLAKGLTNPGMLFQVVNGLIMADGAKILRRFFRSHEVLSQLKQNLDDSQLLRLSCKLLDLRLIKEASAGFVALASKWNDIIPDDLPTVASGLILTENKRKAASLISCMKYHFENVDSESSEHNRIVLAESLLAAGRCDDARSILNSISTNRTYGDIHSQRLFYLHERVAQTLKMREVMPSIIGTTENVLPNLVHIVFSMSYYEGNLEEGLALALKNRIDKRSSLQFLRSIINFHFWLGHFDQAERLLDSPCFSGKGVVAMPGLIIRTNLALAKGQYTRAVGLFEHFLEHSNRSPVKASLRQPLSARYFEFALLLRFLGEKERALEVARECIRKNRAHNNPCRVLVSMLSRELQALPMERKEAKLSERVADTLCMPSSPCQALLYIHAASVYSRLNDGAATSRILRKKLPNAIFISPQSRLLLSNSYTQDISTLRDVLHSGLFPYFKNTYWNNLLDDFLQ